MSNINTQSLTTNVAHADPIKKNSDSMQLFDPQALIIQAINLVIVLFVLWKFLFSPYIKKLDEEEADRQALAADIEKSDTMLSDAQEASKKIEDDAMADANKKTKKIIENAELQAEDIRNQAKQDAEELRTKEVEALEQERKKIYAELKDKVLDVAIKMNEKIFTDKTSHADFLKKNIKDIEL